MRQGPLLLLSIAVLMVSAPALAQQDGQSPIASQTPANSQQSPEAFEPVDPKFVPQVESKASALHVLAVTRRDAYLRIKLKNVGDKKISSFRMSYHQSGASTLISTIQRSDKTALAPGEVYFYQHLSSPSSPLVREPLTFEAVLFEDGTGEGVPEKVKSLQELHNASRKELDAVVALLQTAIDSPNVETLSVVDELEKHLSEVPDYMEGVSLSGLAGLFFTSWKMTALTRVREIRRKLHEGEEVKVQEELSVVKEGFAKTLAKFPKAID